MPVPKSCTTAPNLVSSSTVQNGSLPDKSTHGIRVNQQHKINTSLVIGQMVAVHYPRMNCNVSYMPASRHHTGTHFYACYLWFLCLRELKQSCRNRVRQQTRLFFSHLASFKIQVS